MFNSIRRQFVVKFYTVKKMPKIKKLRCIIFFSLLFSKSPTPPGPTLKTFGASHEVRKKIQEYFDHLGNLVGVYFACFLLPTTAFSQSQENRPNPQKSWKIKKLEAIIFLSWSFFECPNISYRDSKNFRTHSRTETKNYEGFLELDETQKWHCLLKKSIFNHFSASGKDFRGYTTVAENGQK